MTLLLPPTHWLLQPSPILQHLNWNLCAKKIDRSNSNSTLLEEDAEDNVDVQVVVKLEVVDAVAVVEPLPFNVIGQRILAIAGFTVSVSTTLSTSVSQCKIILQHILAL